MVVKVDPVVCANQDLCIRVLGATSATSSVQYQISDLKNGAVLASGERPLKDKKAKAESRLGAQVCIPKSSTVFRICATAIGINNSRTCIFLAEGWKLFN